ncbi:SfnB family sulfur acquisition oxidoreductase [Zavarzinia compransoris]|uniref:SfnB family sulfur acquisition oxidoreductase n=1 Tax=Zavarzinia compransoris TaxID=1264899 RepID=A0A317E8M3_9PROT|nr:SfnB family sulfur acquisition oxidoreductase [Zavarzinia compransoris]PWR23229.1 SfnB family sulfur acquisition oxidoreductase [Zavarzinia compransoris]TDP46211.1 SfnB family sulfur acquisition oxidoreductase [Zavarzinia compransoris]
MTVIPRIDPATAPRVNSSASFTARPKPVTPAQVIADDAGAIAAAEQLAPLFAADAALRDREGLLPIAELDAYSQSGLWGINIPKAYGGAEVSYATLGKVIEIISAADPSIGQITQNHLVLSVHLALDGTEAQKRELFDLVLKGYRFGNAFSELHSKNVVAFETIIRFEGDDAIVNGRKFYTTGALFAHIVPIISVTTEGEGYIAFADREAPGLTVTNDWSSFGQRTTASGSVTIENVRVPRSRVIPIKVFDRPTAAGAISQFIQAAVDTGIGAGAIRDAIDFVRSTSRAWIDSGKDKASEDPFTIQAIGELEIGLHAAQALVERAGRLIDAALADPTEEKVNAATVATAEAKVLSTRIALEASNRLFELAGTRATLAEHNLDRHWRNGRVHTLHDPARWKPYHIGNFYLNGASAPRHPWS